MFSLKILPFVFSQVSRLISKVCKDILGSHLLPMVPCFFLSAGVGSALNLSCSPGWSWLFVCVCARACWGEALKCQTSIFVTVKIAEHRRGRLQTRSEKFCKCQWWEPKSIRCVSLNRPRRGSSEDDCGSPGGRVPSHQRPPASIQRVGEAAAVMAPVR